MGVKIEDKIGLRFEMLFKKGEHLCTFLLLSIFAAKTAMLIVFFHQKDMNMCNIKYLIGVLLICALTACNNSLDADEYQREVRFYSNGELVESNNGQGTHYLNRQNGTNVHSWEFHSNGIVPFLVVAKDDAKRELQDKYEYPNVTARLLKEQTNSIGVITPIWYESISGSLTIDKFQKFTRDGAFEFVLVNQELADTLYITNGFYSLTNQDEPVIRE